MAGQPVQLALKLTRYLVENKIRGRRRFPLTMILEPLEKCNLALPALADAAQRSLPASWYSSP
jgi:hypothetical protein